MPARLSGQSVQGWRLGNRRRNHARPPRVVVAGEASMATTIAARLASSRIAKITLLVDTARAAAGLSSLPGDRIRVSVREDAIEASDALIVCSPPEEDFAFSSSRIQELTRVAGHSSPEAVLIIAAAGGLDLSARAARTSWRNPFLILSPGAMPLVAAEQDRLASCHHLNPAQIQMVAIGADSPGGLCLIERYTKISGVPVSALNDGVRRKPPPVWHGPDRAQLEAAALALAKVVILDQRAVVCCGAWVEGTLGIPGAFVTTPVRVGACGTEEPLPLRFTLEERSFLMAAARLV